MEGSQYTISATSMIEKFEKMSKDGKIYRIMFHIINALLFVGAIVGLISMIAIMVNYKEYIDLLGDNASWIIAMLVVIIAFLMIIISALGFLGGFGENTLLLKIYVAIVAVLMILLIVAGAVAFAQRKNTIAYVEENMLHNMALYVPESEEFETIVWDDIQQNFECCGVKKPEDWARYHHSYKRTSSLTKKPNSCSSEDKTIHYVDGCMEKLSENIRKEHWNIGGAIAGIFLYLLLAICMACMVMKYISEDELLIVTTPRQNGQDNHGIYFQTGLQTNGNLAINSQTVYPSLQDITTPQEKGQDNHGIQEGLQNNGNSEIHTNV